MCDMFGVIVWCIVCGYVIVLMCVLVIILCYNFMNVNGGGGGGGGFGVVFGVVVFVGGGVVFDCMYGLFVRLEEMW